MKIMGRLNIVQNKIGRANFAGKYLKNVIDSSPDSHKLSEKETSDTQRLASLDPGKTTGKDGIREMSVAEELSLIKVEFLRRVEFLENKMK